MADAINKDDFRLTSLEKSDEEALVRFLNDWQIYKNTLQIPYPYTHADAQFWINKVLEFEQQYGKRLNWAIRDQKGNLIGGIGLHYSYGLNAHKNEMGYWLARPYWNQGIMTRVIDRFTNYAIEELQFIRLEAPVFESNAASAKVLEKNGFEYEGRLKKCYYKDGEYFDSLLYAKVT